MGLSFTIKDAISLSSVATGIFAVLIIAEVLRRKNIVDGKTSRKIIHITVGNVVLLFPFCFSSLFATLIGPLFFVFFTWLTCPGSPIKKFRMKAVEEGHTYGTVYYAISLNLLLILFFRPDPNDSYNLILIASFLPLVWGDGISGIIGERYGKKIKDGKKSEKTLLGMWCAAITSFIVVVIGFLIYRYPFTSGFYFGLWIGLISAFVELFSPKGLDNLTIPIVNALFLYGMFNLIDFDIAHFGYISLSPIITSIVLGLILAIGGLKLHALTWDGAIAGVYFGMIILGVGSWPMGVAYGTFFVLGSIITFVGKKRKEKIVSEFEKGSTARDSIQVLVNSIVPAVIILLSILMPLNVMLVIALSAIAVSLADTMGTEVGTLSESSPRLAHKPWKKSEKGSPGAISITGLIGSAIGALIISIAGFLTIFVISGNYPQSSFLAATCVFIGGFMGAYLDSIFGATIQRMNKCVICSKVVETDTHCGSPTRYYHGAKWINNDINNILSITAGSLLAAVLYAIVNAIKMTLELL
ncbi:MAG: DUF92 domain-containing protein [Candidatus Heimdallarchaeaceae archaeon]